MIGNQCVSLAAVAALSLLRVTVDEKAAIHRVVQAANFVFDQKDRTAIIGVDDFLKPILMIAHFFGDQAAALQVSISPGKIGHINGNMVPVVRCQRRFGLPK